MVVSLHVVVGSWIFGTSDHSHQPHLLGSNPLAQVHCSCLQTHQKKGIWSHYGWLWATMWLLGFELRTFGRAVSALTRWAILPAREIVFNSWVVFDCVNIPHFLYPFFHWGTSGLFPASGMFQAAIKIVEHVSVLYVGASFGYMPRSGIVGS